MEQPRYKIGDIVEAENIHGTKFIFKVADSQKNSYDLMFDEMAAEKAKLTDDFRTVAKILAERNPELGSWLLCNWGSELSGHI